MLFPPGTGKWNMIGHRLFCHINRNWRGRPLRTLETIVGLIGRARSSAGLRANARLDTRTCRTGRVVTPAGMKTLARHPQATYGEWSDELEQLEKPEIS